MRPVALTKHLTSGSINCIATAQAVAAAGNVILNGGSVSSQPAGAFGASISIAVLDTQRRIAIASDGDDSLLTAHIYGNRQNGQPISEVLTLANTGTVVSVLDYLNVATVAVSGAVANHITIGTNGTGSTDWIMPNYHLTPFNIGVDIEQTSTVTWNFETTNDRYVGPNDPTLGTTPKPNATAVISGGTASQTSTLTSAVTGYRFTVTTGTGTIAAQAVQAGVING